MMQPDDERSGLTRRSVSSIGNGGADNISLSGFGRMASMTSQDGSHTIEMRNMDALGIGTREEEELGFVSGERKKKPGAIKRVKRSCWAACGETFANGWRAVTSCLLRRHEPGARIITLGDAHNPVGKFCGNVICNQKYNIITFLPLVLFEQFSFFFNFYFLIVALSQFITPLKIGYLYTYWGPLIFVLAVTISKEAWDDFSRYRRDREVNGKVYMKLTGKGDVATTSSEMKVGDIIKVHTNERVPADMVFLRTTEKSGACFIRTDQLDGETDWKLRLAVASCQKLPCDADLLGRHVSVYADKPSKDIHNFVGTFSTYPEDSSQEPQVESLSVDNILWANTVVASGTALGLVVYTGKETRSVMNTSQPRTKVGLLDYEINVFAKVLFVLTMALAFVLVALKGLNGAWYIYMFRFVLLFSYIIPISLRVNLDLGKTFYTREIESDKEIPDTVVRTSTIPEELGRIRYLLSDKTGTLTQNEMIFRKLHLGTVSFSVETQDEIREHVKEAFSMAQQQQPQQGGPAFLQPAISTFQPSSPTGPRGKSTDLGVQESVFQDQFLLRGPTLLTSTAGKVSNMILAIALCHNVTPLINDEGNFEYQAASPDEVALVGWTATVGIKLMARDLNFMELEGPSGEKMKFEVLTIFPFTSETKRMGIVVREVDTGDITFYCKGADTIMQTIVQYNDWLEEECGNMAREGLRTLVIARKCLGPDEYDLFAERLAEAKCSLTNRDQNVMQVRMSLERDLELLGVTGVEDKLQEDIKPTLETLRNAGIRIWMLTGDKMETATNIAISSRLVSRTQTIYQFKPETDAKQNIQSELTNFRKKTDCALIIDGHCLRLCIELFESEFMELACAAPAVVCCRCAPTQKADIVRLIRSYTGLRTCAIGDGGNDVSMIQAADVGIGLVGKEGKQASLAADFSMTKFKHLSRLLLYHGRNSYKRSAALAQFVVHRGLIISVMQAVFSAVFYFSAVALYQGILMVGYTTVYTMLPVFSLVLDEDVPSQIAMLYPELYRELTKGRSLTLKTFFLWCLISTYQGGVIMLGALLLFSEGDFLNIVAISFTSLILTELLMVALTIHRWHWAMVVSEILSLGIYVLSMFVLTTYFDMRFILTPDFMWRVAVITLISYLPLWIAKHVYLRISPPAYKKLT